MAKRKVNNVDPAVANVLANAKPLSLAPRPVGPVIVVTLCKDYPEVVRSFVHQQLAMGAESLIIYFDDPADPAFEWTAAQDRVTAVLCDAEFWTARAHNGRTARPEHIEARQAACYLHAYRQFGPDKWIGYCDVDELFVPKVDFHHMLSHIGEQVEQIAAPVIEAIWAPGKVDAGLKSATLARAPAAREEVTRSVTQNRSALFRTFSEGGLMGHVWGKALIRGGIPDCIPCIHRHKRPKEGGGEQWLRFQMGEVYVVHFDALSYDIWVNKHVRRLQRETKIGGNAPRRTAQSELFGYCTDQAARRRLFEELYGTDLDYLQTLHRHGKLYKFMDLDAL